jgi:hypothetical protein
VFYAVIAAFLVIVGCSYNQVYHSNNHVLGDEDAFEQKTSLILSATSTPSVELIVYHKTGNLSNVLFSRASIADSRPFKTDVKRQFVYFELGTGGYTFFDYFQVLSGMGIGHTKALTTTTNVEGTYLRNHLQVYCKN